MTLGTRGILGTAAKLAHKWLAVRMRPGVLQVPRVSRVVMVSSHPAAIPLVRNRGTNKPRVCANHSPNHSPVPNCRYRPSSACPSFCVFRNSSTRFTRCSWANQALVQNVT